jgi:hypothetical protein
VGDLKTGMRKNQTEELLKKKSFGYYHMGNIILLAKSD